MKKIVVLFFAITFTFLSCKKVVENDKIEIQSTNEIWEINKDDYSFTIEILDSVQYYHEKTKSKNEPYKIQKITDYNVAKKMLKGIVEFRENEHYISLRRIFFRNGEIFVEQFNEMSFVAYYPTEDIIVFEGGHSSDMSFNLNNGKEIEEVGNPEYIVTSPNNKFRLNGYYDGQECVTYFIQKNINGDFVNVIPINENFIRNNKINICGLKDIFWSDDQTIYFKESMYIDGEVSEKSRYYKVSIKKADKPLNEKHSLFQSKNPSDFIPEGYVIYKEEGVSQIKGDLNKDGLEDLVMIIKGTEKSYIVKDEIRGELDKNRRGIIILFNKGSYYELALKNYNCFTSENEDGGVYYPPDLFVEIVKGNLLINYLHGRYGYWNYTFRYQNRDFELIGYDESNNRGPIVESDVSINFLSRKLVQRENINQNTQDDGDEVFKETRNNINVDELVRLSEVNFDDIDIHKLYTIKR